ncbi:hypothetical protein [Hymenobacter sp. IS2118]|uniref:hypothetical protein n=1 Tax=Hymenobacter sp. IS2118 TaxID=1505605 RepID=UPI00054CF3F7|nr:hypothetical protein [Hymenobacter sp. IS2118]
MKNKSFFGLDRHLLAVIFFWLLALTLRPQTASSEEFSKVPAGPQTHLAQGAAPAPETPGR